MNATPSITVIRDTYARMLFTRLVDDYAWQLHTQGYIDFVASCRGHEAAQIGSAICIEVGKDFTLPYYRDLGVVLTIGMTPYDVFRTYLQTHPAATTQQHIPMSEKPRAFLHWGYHKHNTITDYAPIATQILHAAGIAFSSKLRKAQVVTVAYCSDGATTEPDFLEGIRFAAEQTLPIVFVCERNCAQTTLDSSRHVSSVKQPHLTKQYADGSDVLAVYQAMSSAMHRARTGQGPTFLDIAVTRLRPPRCHTTHSDLFSLEAVEQQDPLYRCRQLLQELHLWNDDWADQLYTRYSMEIERALHDALHDTQQQCMGVDARYKALP